MSASTEHPRHARRPGTAARPFSIRLTDEERRLLAEQAGRLPLATYIRDLLLSRASQTRRQSRAGKVRDHEALARVLANLGQSRIANNLNQLAKAVNIGALPVTPETEQDIAAACGAVVAMRRDLMTGLGIDTAGGPL